MVETSGTSKYSASAMAGWATSQSWACTTSGCHGRLLRRPLNAKPGADHRVAHGQRPCHHVGAEIEFVRVLRGGDNPDAFGDFVGGRMRARVGAAGTTAEHHDLMAGRGQRRRQLVHVAAEPADHDRRVLPRHHQDLHARSIRCVGPRASRGRAQNVRIWRRVDVQTRTVAVVVIAEAAWRRGRRTDRRRGSSRRPAAVHARGGRTPARR